MILTAGVAYEARVHHTSTETRRLLSGDTASRTRLTVAKIKSV